MLIYGAFGVGVQALQRALNVAGFGPLVEDGRFLNKTLSAVMRFQRSRCLEVDGVVGPLTAAALGVAGRLSPLPLVTPGTMRRACALGPTIKGIDISSYQPHVNWELIKKSGVEFVFIKSSQWRKDSRFDAHWAEAKAAKVIRGAYHFFNSSQDPRAQAALMAKCVGRLDEEDMPCVLDVEQERGFPLPRVAQAQIFLEEIEVLTGKRPLVYSGPYFLKTIGAPAAWAKHWLWVAHYGTDCPLVPYPWTDWLFHQTSGTARVPGISSPQCDTDVFNGTLEDLKAFCRGSVLS